MDEPKEMFILGYVEAASSVALRLKRGLVDCSQEMVYLNGHGLVHAQGVPMRGRGSVARGIQY